MLKCVSSSYPIGNLLRRELQWLVSEAVPSLLPAITASFLFHFLPLPLYRDREPGAL